MKKYLEIFLITLLLSASYNSYAQTGVMLGQWRTHLSYNETKQIAVTNQKVYAISNGALYSLQKEDNSIQTYSKTTGLSDNNISYIKNIEKEKMLLIGYENGNIDFLYENGEIINLSDIYNKNIIANKKINDALYLNGHLYLALPFGIVKINVKKNEISDTYYFKDNNDFFIDVLSLFVIGNEFYALTPNKILKAPTDGVSLANFANWSELSGVQSGKNIKASSDGTKLYLLQEKGYLSVYNNGIWTNNIDSMVISFNICDEVLIIVKEKEILVPQKIECDFYPQMVVLDKYKVWIASLYNGIGEMDYKNLSYVEFYKPNGPATNEIWRTKFANKKIYAVSGGRWDVPYNIKANVMIFEDEQWKNITQKDMYNKIKVNLLDFVDIAIDRNEENHFFVASCGYGMLEFRNNQIFKHYTRENSGIGSTMIGNVTFDSNNKLWLSTPFDQVFLKYAVKSSNNNYDIKPISFANSQSVFTTSDLLIDNTNENFKYLIVARGKDKLVALDDKGTEDVSDDEIRGYSQFIDQDGKVFKAEHYMCGAVDKQTGALWVGTTSGPVIMPNPQNIFNPNYRCQRIKIPLNDGTNLANYLLENDIISTIAIDGNNRKWVGTESSGAYLLSEDGTETILHFTVDNSPILSNFIRNIEINNNTGEVFFTTNKGLISYQGDAIEASYSFSSLYAYPNPVRPDYHGDIAIKGLAENSVVKITDLRGNLVFETVVKGGMAIWSGKRADGKRVSSGVYLAICNTIDKRKNGIVKILVIN